MIRWHGSLVGVPTKLTKLFYIYIYIYIYIYAYENSDIYGMCLGKE